MSYNCIREKEEEEGSGLEQGSGPTKVLVQSKKVIEGRDMTGIGTLMRKVTD